MTQTELSYLVDYAQRSFRDIADTDYIAARACHRLGLDQQFLWCALQSVEKYIKGILLFNERSTKKLGHDLKKAFDALFRIVDINFQFTSDIEGYIQYLNIAGPNRYFTYPYKTNANDLLMLDKTVWHLRRYCQYLRSNVPGLDQNQSLKFNLDIIHGPLIAKTPMVFRITNGFLENLITKKNSPMRNTLIWKNFYFGAKAKSKRTMITWRTSAAQPPHFARRESYVVLRNYVQFERMIEEHFGFKVK